MKHQRQWYLLCGKESTKGQGFTPLTDGWGLY